nr:recombinase family protein [Phyllobacterium sp. IY22]
MLLDRLARSVRHRLQVIEHLEQVALAFDRRRHKAGFSLQVLGAVAQLERSLIPKRTNAGIKAKARGKLPGNPGFREPRPDALAKASRARRRSHLADLTTNMSSWLPIVQRMRPDHPGKT